MKRVPAAGRGFSRSLVAGGAATLLCGLLALPVLTRIGKMIDAKAAREAEDARAEAAQTT